MNEEIYLSNGMYDSEKVAEYFLREQYTSIIVKPEGENSPPDFAIDNNIGVEVSQLSKSYLVNGKKRAYRETVNPFAHFMENLVQDFNHNHYENKKTYFIRATIKNDSLWLRNNRKIKKLIKFVLTKVAIEGIEGNSQEFSVFEGLDLKFKRRQPYKKDTVFIWGSLIHKEGGVGWVIPDILENTKLYSDHKLKKIKQVRGKYDQIWLLLVDSMCYCSGYSAKDLKDYAPGLLGSWDKLIFVSAINHQRYLEVW